MPCLNKCLLSEESKIWKCANECFAYEALDSNGSPYLRAPRRLHELPHSVRLSCMDDFIGNALLSIGVTVTGTDYGYGTPLFRATSMTYNEAKKHPHADLLLSRINDLPIKFMN